IDEYATGTSGFHGAEGTWRDAEDGHLQGNAIAQGAVDSTISHHVNLAPDGERTIYMVMIAGESREELIEMHKWLTKMSPQGVIDRTTAYWRLWVGGTNINFGNLPPKVVDLFKRSLLVVRTQIDNGWAMCRHYYRYRDIGFVRPLWVDVVQKAADFMCRYRDPRTGLPHPSYDLWEERWGVHAFTVATVYGGLKAARNFAVCFGDREKAERYNKAAEEIRAGAAKYLWSDK